VYQTKEDLLTGIGIPYWHPPALLLYWTVSFVLIVLFVSMLLTQEVPSKNFSPIRLQFSGRVQTVEQKILNFEIIFFSLRTVKFSLIKEKYFFKNFKKAM